MKRKALLMKSALHSVLLILLLSAVGIGKMYAYDFSAICETGQTLYYNIIDADNHFVELTCPGVANYDDCWLEFTKPIGDIVFPESVQYEDGIYAVTMIGDYAFSDCYGLTGELIIPNSVISIGIGAFVNCNGFTNNLIIGNSVLTIGQEAFEYCISFTGNLIIPDSVTAIGDGAFYGCSGFTGSLSIPNSVASIGNYAFYGCRGFTGSLTIPNSVTSIGNYTFCNCSGLTGSLTIGNSVITIGDYAFYGCSGFTGNLIIPNSMTVIGDGVFYNCSGFTGSLTIGNSVTAIGDYTFYGCNGFTGSLTIPNSVITIGDWAFYSCRGFAGSLTIGNSVTTIGDHAFYGCRGFTGSLTIGNSVNTIGSHAFYGCSGFTGSLTIPNSVITIGDSAFSYCSDFMGILTIGNSVTTIGNYAFESCWRFYSIISVAETSPTLGNSVFESWNENTPVYVPCGFDETYLSSSWGGFSNFYGICGGMVTVGVAPEGGGTVTGGGSFEAGETCTVMATAFEGYAFAAWTINGIIVSGSVEYTFYVSEDMALIARFVPEGNIDFADSTVKGICVTHWDANGDEELSYSEAASVSVLFNYFQDNFEITSFEELRYFTGLTTIGDYAFYNCSNLSGSLHIPNSVTTIGENAFWNCGGFTGSLTIPNSVITIGDWAFYSCSGFTGSLTIPNSVTSIGGGAFAGCIGFTGSLTIPNSVTTIDPFAFGGCSGFTGSLIIPNSVTTIGYGTFSGCSGFTGSLSIPNSVTTIGNSAFYNCNGFSEMMMFGTIASTLGYGAFDYSDFPIYVPYESLNDYKTATNWSDYEDRIFPMTYTIIPGYDENESNYRFVASPLVEDTDPTMVDNMITETAYDLYRFDQSEDAEWRNYKANTEDFVLENGQGYLYANAEDVNIIFKGEFNEEETKEMNLVYDANAGFVGWNLVGNPFPINAYANKSYYTMNEEGTAIEPNMVSSATAIPACTGVVVMAETEGETVVFSTEAPEAATNQGCLRIALSQAVELVETPTRKQDGPSTGSGTLHDKAIVSFNANDRLEKFVFNKENAVISIPQGGKELAIVCTDKQGEMPLNFKATKNGEYTLTINSEAVELDYLHLIDNLTGNDIDLLATPNYTFEAKTGDYVSRFRLVFSIGEGH